MEQIHHLNIKPTSIEDLPNEILSHILSFLTVKEQKIASLVSKKFFQANQITQNNYILTKHLNATNTIKSLYEFNVQYTNPNQTSLPKKLSHNIKTFIGNNDHTTYYILDNLTNFLHQKLENILSKDEWEKTKDPVAKAICLAQYIEIANKQNPVLAKRIVCSNYFAALFIIKQKNPSSFISSILNQLPKNRTPFVPYLLSSISDSQIQLELTPEENRLFQHLFSTIIPDLFEDLLKSNSPELATLGKFLKTNNLYYAFSWSFQEGLYKKVGNDWMSLHTTYFL